MSFAFELRKFSIDINIYVVHTGKYLLSKHLGSRQVKLLVLDDVAGSGVNALDVLLLPTLPKGSVVIITTRDKDIVQKLPEYNQVVDIQPLNPENALTLFNSYAARSKEIPLNLRGEVVDACGGLPLTLEASGIFIMIL